MLPFFDLEGNLFIEREENLCNGKSINEDDLIEEAISQILATLNPPIALGNGHILDACEGCRLLTFRVFADGAYFDMDPIIRKDDGRVKFNIAFVSNVDKPNIHPVDIDGRY